MSGTRVTAQDLNTGESEEVTITDDYVIVCDGRCHVAHIQSYPEKGTTLLTVKTAPASPEPTNTEED